MVGGILPKKFGDIYYLLTDDVPLHILDRHYSGKPILVFGIGRKIKIMKLWEDDYFFFIV